VAGSPGHRRIAATVLAGAEVAAEPDLSRQVGRLLQGKLGQIVVRKGQLDPFEEPLMNRLLDELGPARAVVYGVATEYCVRLAVLGLCRTGCTVTVLEDAIRGIDSEAAAQALEEMRSAGATVQQTSGILTALAAERGGQTAGPAV
jgi:nicotinamidase/pyrazinamidase